MKRDLRHLHWLQLLPLLFVAVFFAWPVLTIATRYARVADITHVITDASLLEVWWFTFWQATLSTVLTIAVAMPVTWTVSRHTFTFSRIITGLITLPFFMPAVVIATGVHILLPHPAVPAILWAHVAFNVAVVVRIVGPRWALLDPGMEDTAADLGATSFRTFIYVVFPHLRSALRNAAAMVFLFCFTSFSAIVILGGAHRRTVESEIYTQAIRIGNMKVATALALLQAVAVLSVLFIGNRGMSKDLVPNGDINVQPKPLGDSRTSRLLVFTAAFIPLVIVVAPLWAVVLRSFWSDGHFSVDSFRWLFNGTTESVGIHTSSVLLTSVAFAVVCAFIATTLGLIISSGRRTQKVITSLASLPLIVSAVTLGLGLIITFDSAPFEWRSHRWLIPIIHAVIALPLVVRLLSPAISAIPAELHDASSSLGAGQWRTWRKVDMPLLRPALLRAFGLCAAISLGEFGATSFLSRSGSTTIPIAIAQLLSHPGDVLRQAAYALAALVVVIFTAVFSLV